MSDLQNTIKQIERLQYAPQLVRGQADEHGVETLAEICAEVEMTVRDESLERDVGKHGGIACLYMVISRLSEDDDV